MGPMGGAVTPITMTSASYFQAVNTVTDANFKLYDVVAPALDDLLKTRIDGLVQRRNLVLILALLGFALSWYLFEGFYLAVRNTIAALDYASKRMISGQMSEAVVLNNRDELADVAVVEHMPKLEGRQMIMVLAPK